MTVTYTESQPKVTCPSCQGRRVQVIATSPLGLLGPTRRLPCVTCDGTGKITMEFLQRILHGRYVRAHRIKAGRSVEDEALRLGIKPRELTDLENGLPIEGGLPL